MKAKKIGWREEDEDGQVYEVVALRWAGGYRSRTRPKGEMEWTYLEEPPRRHLERLLELVEQRYNRRRIAYKDVETVRQMLAEIDD